MEKYLMECPVCLGTKSVFEPTDEDGLEGDVVPCKACEGTGEVVAIDDNEAGQESYFYEDDMN